VLKTTTYYNKYSFFVIRSVEIIAYVLFLCILIKEDNMNTFWPVYKNLETEFLKITYYIHIDNEQLSVYSSKIAELLLRTVVEIESISKLLYATNGGEKTDFIKYDEDAIKLLKQKWLIDKKTILITLPNCFISVNELYPFIKDTPRTGKSNMTYSWNNAYQNIKHDRAKYLKDANIKNLIAGMAALFLLNLYYSDLIFDLEKDVKGLTLSPNMGSKIFSIIIDKGNHDGKGNYIKTIDFDKSVYYINHTEATGKIFFDSMKDYLRKADELVHQHPKVIEFLNNPDPLILQKDNWLWEVLGQEEYINVMSHASRITEIKSEQLRYEAHLNKHNF